MFIIKHRARQEKSSARAWPPPLATRADSGTLQDLTAAAAGGFPMNATARNAQDVHADEL
jgi:hypothetical protein